MLETTWTRTARTSAGIASHLPLSGPVFLHPQKATTPNTPRLNFSSAHACTVQSVPTIICIYFSNSVLTLEKDLLLMLTHENLEFYCIGLIVRQHGIETERLVTCPD